MKWLRLMWVLMFTAFAGFGLVGCEKNEGPAEEVGEEIDEAADELEDVVDKAESQ